MKPSRPSKVDRHAARLLAFCFVLFWALPLAVGTWLGWGTDLLLTPWDAGAFSLVAGIALYEMVKSGRGLLDAL